MSLLSRGDAFPMLMITPVDTDPVRYPRRVHWQLHRSAVLPRCPVPLLPHAASRIPTRTGHVRRNPDAIAAATGAFVNPEPRHLQSTAFVLDPAGNILVSVYSSGAIERLVPDDVIGMIRYATEHQAA
jgi:hypothetical protein